MSFKKFAPNEVITNTMRTYPRSEFVIYNGLVYYNSYPNTSGSRNSTVKNVPNGHLSLYEYNIDRPKVTTGRGVGSSSIPDTGRIYPWISKNSANSSFRTAVGLDAEDETSYMTEFFYGDIIRSTYPLSASITRMVITTPSSSSPAGKGVFNKYYFALRNKLNYYGARSPHYMVSSSYGDKDSKPINIIHVPSIFYGTKIKPGSVSLKFYLTGALCAELTDANQNGELIQKYSSRWAKSHDGTVAGVVMYEEGFIILTGSWNLTKKQLHFDSGSLAKATWLHFAAGCNDGNTMDTSGARFSSGSYHISFKGTTDTQVVTMFAHAKKGEVNYSNNPTYLEHGQNKIFKTSSAVYEESGDLRIKNFTSSSYLQFDAPFKRSVYVSKVAIYDKYKNLIGVATLGSPILKEEDQDYTFKLKLDI